MYNRQNKAHLQEYREKIIEMYSHTHTHTKYIYIYTYIISLMMVT